MLKNYVKTAWRNLQRNKIYTAINIAGLALGIAVFLFLMEYLAFEWGANRYNQNYDRLYRVNARYKEGNTDYNLPPGFAPVIRQQFPEIGDFTRIAEYIGNGVITYNPGRGKNKVFDGGNILYTDGNFLSEFSFPLVAGTPSFTEPATLALSETMSKKLFGAANAVGKAVTVSNQFGNTLYTVNAVYRLPQTSDIRPDVLLSLKTLETPANRDGNDWADPATTDNGFTSIYLHLNRGTNAALLAQKITQFVRSINPDSGSDVVYLQPMNELHLAPSFDYPYQTYGNVLLVFVFGCIALLIIIIAWLNYINLSTAQAINQSKEMGVRKVLGASRGQLIVQHLLETLLLTGTSAILAVCFVSVFQNLFNQFAGKEFSLSVLQNGLFWAISVLVIGAGALLAGGYVAWVITGFKTAAVIRDKGKMQIKGFSVHKALVVFQFVVSVVFIIATAVLYKQLRFMRTENLGMNLEQLLVIKGPSVATEDQAARNLLFKNQLGQLPFISKYAASNNVPGSGYNFFANGISGSNTTELNKQKSYAMFICDQNFFDTYDIRFVQGKTFSATDAERSWNNVKKVIINQKAAQQLGYDPKENLIGKKVSWGEQYEIIGVIQDYHHLSLREAIAPTIYLGSVGYSYFTVQTDVSNLPAKLSTLKKIYSQTFTDNPFDYFFADQNYDRQYRSEQQLGKIFIASAFTAVLIACLGLYGVTTFTTRQRIKEVGIRKVLGASVANIISLLSKDFLILVLIALAIASPVAWWVMNSWLDNFAYKTSISAWIFIASGVIAVLIAFITVSFQAIKAALANPVESLRTE